MGTFTVFNTKEYKEQPVPEVGKEYNIFDDGKLSPSRHYLATITELIPFDDCNHTIYDMWKANVNWCPHLYSETTDYIVKAEAKYYSNDVPLYFVRTTDGSWFSLGWFGARLDIDGSLFNKMIERCGGAT